LQHDWEFATHRLIGWSGNTFSYDPNGNLASDGLTSYTWNARNQLIGLSGGASATFAYDAFGRRQSKTVGGTSTNFLSDGVNLVQELSGTTPTANLLTGVGIDEIFTRTDGSGTRTMLVDALGSTLELADASGTLQTHYSYEPFGATTTSGATNTNAAQFTGRENDGTGLYAYRARYYSPQLQRFVAEDPLGFGGGLNVYAYVDNRPADLVDPSGLSAYLYCEQIPSTRGGGPVGAAALALTAARHCYIRVTCPGKYDVTLELYGPGAPNGRLWMGVPNPTRNAAATVNPIYPRQPNPDGCCKFENELIRQFNLHQPPPLYNPQGPNSNTFVADIIRAAGGLVVFPGSAVGADYNNR
jgi:RHS repeat-associated protein